MKLHKIVRPYRLENHLVLGLDSEWLDYLKEDPTFTVKITNKKLILESELKDE